MLGQAPASQSRLMHREEAGNWKCWEPPGVVLLFHDFLAFFEVFFGTFMLDMDGFRGFMTQ